MRCSACGHENTAVAPTCGGCGAELGTAPADIAADLVAGRFELRERLGDGHRKQVFRAVDHALRREVALALVRWDSLSVPERARVERELEIVAALSASTHVVALFDAFPVDHSLALVFEYLAGGSLCDLLDALGGHGLPVADVVRIGRHVALGLAAAHRAGVIVRDVKPDNILLTGDGTAKIADFGLALRQAADRRLTDEGVVVGTFSYLAPERIRRSHYDHRSDLYALGIVVYEMLVGEPPFPGGDPDEVAAQHLTAEPPPVADRRAGLPSELVDLVDRLLAKSLADRPDDAATVAAELARCAAMLDRANRT